MYIFIYVQTIVNVSSIVVLLLYVLIVTAYAQAVELSSTEEDRILVCTALGMVAYKYNDLNGAKTALFKW